MIRIRRTGGNGLLKTSEMAKEAGVLPSTIRFYTRIGLLKPTEILPSGYRLYEREETLKKVRFIRSSLEKKPTLAKIKEEAKRNGFFE